MPPSFWDPVLYWWPGWLASQQGKHAVDDSPVSCPPMHYPEQYYTTKRVNASTGAVRGFPSTGGILKLGLDIVKATYLDLPRFSDLERSFDPDDEDKFCDQLRLLGATWWQDEMTSLKIIFEDEPPPYTPEQLRQLLVGWPTDQSPDYGGVWILRAATWRDLPKGFGKFLSMCVDMDERCSLLKQWDAMFYEDPATVPEFKEVFEKAATRQSSSVKDEAVSDRSEL